MGVVIIPFDYEQLPESERKAIVPICIASVDRHGHPIARVWFEKGVAPIEKHLRNIARYQLGDVRLVSELTETVVHRLWEKHGEEAGFLPWRRVYIAAVHEARELAAGGSRWYLQHTVPLTLTSVEGEIYEARAADPTDYSKLYEQNLMIGLVERRIDEQHREDIRQCLMMLRAGYSWEEIGEKLGYRTPEAPRKRFKRWIKQNFPDAM